MTAAGVPFERTSETERMTSERIAESELLAAAREARLIEVEIARAVVGQSQAVRQSLVAVLAGGHALLEGVPGIGKTLLVRSLARVLGLELSRVQCTPDLIPADITGTNVLFEDDRLSRQIRFQPGPIFSSMILADEVNRATPKTQSAFLEAMEERQVTVAGKSHPLPQPFIMLATQNPIEMEGTFPLPEAQLDRFLFKILIGYPTKDELIRIAQETTDSGSQQLDPVVAPDRVLAMQRLARRIPIASELVEAVVQLVRATHPADGAATEEVRRFVRLGASPRAAQAMVLGAKVQALLAGRPHVTRSDLAGVLRPALRHRVLLNFEAHASAVEVEHLLDALDARFLS